MKIFFIYTFLILALFTFSHHTAMASGNGSFGGKVVGIKADEIRNAEDAGYDCEIPGKTVQIETKNGSEGYFISSRIVPRIRRIIQSGQHILGIRNSYRRIVCTKKDDDSQSRIIVTLRNASYIGN